MHSGHMHSQMDEDVLRGRSVGACYERKCRPEDGQAFLLLAVQGSVKKRGWVREDVASRLFPRAVRAARLGSFDIKPAGQKPRMPAVGEEVAHVLTRLAFRPHAGTAAHTPTAAHTANTAPTANTGTRESLELEQLENESQMGLFCGLLSPLDDAEGCLSLDNTEGYQRLDDAKGCLSLDNAKGCLSLDDAEDKRNHVQSSDPLEPYIFDPSCLLPDDVTEAEAEAKSAPMSDELALLQRLDALQKRIEALEAKNELKP